MQGSFIRAFPGTTWFWPDNSIFIGEHHAANHLRLLSNLRTGAHHLAIETGRWARPKLPRQHRVCSKCSCTVVEDEVHFLFECPAYDRIREKYNTVLFAQFGGCQEASSTMKHNSDNVRLFMDQEPRFQVAKFVYEQQQTFKVWQPQRAARSKRPNTPSDGSKHNGFQTTNQAVLIPKHVPRQDRAHDQEHHPLLHRLQWHGKQ